MFEAFRYLEEDKHREARRVLYNYAQDKEIDITFSIFGQSKSVGNSEKMVLRVCIDIVRNGFDQIGLMIKNKMIPEKGIGKLFWIVEKD